MKMDITKELIKLILDSLNSFVRDDIILLDRMVSERALCGALMLKIHTNLQKTAFAGYYVDVEFNKSMKLKGKEYIYDLKRLPNGKYISTDIIVHGRWLGVEPDNLIAIEMKKKINSGKEYKTRRAADIQRLKDLTNPNYMYRYLLGVFVEIDFTDRKIGLKLYKRGEELDMNIERIQFYDYDRHGLTATPSRRLPHGHDGVPR